MDAVRRFHRIVEEAGIVKLSDDGKTLAFAVPIADRISFFNERVDLVVDGEAQQRPQTPWSTTGWAARQ